jgi:tubulysin polyketide synthase-like protein
MTTTALIADLTARGVAITQVNGEIRVAAPKGELTDRDILVIRDHKPELLTLLDVPCRWDEYQDAIAHAFANPSTREDIGPLWMTDPGGFGPCKPRLSGGLCSSPQPATHTRNICERCGSD